MNENPPSTLREQSERSLLHPSPKSQVSQKLKNTSKSNVKLQEDSFGYFVDKAGKNHTIKRFTWRNHNNIQAQVITYGARIISLKLPSRKHIVDDVVLGFDDMPGYLKHSNLYFGATIGRVTDKIEKGTFVLDHHQHWLTVNDHIHHCNGGFQGLDKVVWIPNVQGTKLMLSYLSSDLEEGYPGDLLVRIVFELTSKNEFIIDMDALTTKPTILNLSNLLYFNLAGHGAGPDELYKHIVSINANCFTPLQDNGLPTGEIFNIIYSKNDFQIPKLLKDVMGTEPDDGFNVHLCINRGIDQGLCFAARAVHPPTGRILEMYSNQYGVHFSTANDLGFGIANLNIASFDRNDPQRKSDDGNSIFLLIEKIHAQLSETLTIDNETNYEDLRNLIIKMCKHKFSFEKSGEDSLSPEKYLEGLNEIIHTQMEALELNPVQVKYLEGMKDVVNRRDTLTDYKGIGEIIQTVLDDALVTEEVETSEKRLTVEETAIQLHKEQHEKDLEDIWRKEDKELERKAMLKVENKLAPSYKDERIHGKNDAIYKKHGAMCFQSENYPNAVYHKNFPKCELRPGETYKHTIVYKFWLQSGNPNKWIKRNFPTPR